MKYLMPKRGDFVDFLIKVFDQYLCKMKEDCNFGDLTIPMSVWRDFFDKEAEDFRLSLKSAWQQYEEEIDEKYGGQCQCTQCRAQRN